MGGDRGLRPCPFCGGPAKLAAHGFSNSKVVCAGDHCCEAMSIAVWNHRKDDGVMAVPMDPLKALGILMEIMALTWRPNPDEPARIDIAPGNHREFQRLIQSAADQMGATIPANTRKDDDARPHA